MESYSSILGEFVYEDHGTTDIPSSIMTTIPKYNTIKMMLSVIVIHIHGKNKNRCLNNRADLSPITSCICSLITIAVFKTY
jgi:hypothetical protein